MKDGKYINITINISDEVDKYGNNVSAWENQTKDERDSKAKRNYLGNGKVLYTSGDVLKHENGASAPAKEDTTNEIPF